MAEVVKSCIKEDPGLLGMVCTCYDASGQVGIWDLYAALLDRGYVKKEETFWYGWNDLEISLPGVLLDDKFMDEDWDWVSVFTPELELRRMRCGIGRVLSLLTEKEDIKSIAARWMADQGLAPEASSYTAGEGKRLLSGGRIEVALGRGEKAKIREIRGEMRYPRELTYNIACENDKILSARVFLYKDAEMRLAEVRYASVGAL